MYIHTQTYTNIDTYMQMYMYMYSYTNMYIFISFALIPSMGYTKKFARIKYFLSLLSRFFLSFPFSPSPPTTPPLSPFSLSLLSPQVAFYSCANCCQPPLCTLQHTAYCNTLQHIATYCNTLHHATHCKTPHQLMEQRCNCQLPSATIQHCNTETDCRIRKQPAKKRSTLHCTAMH